MRPKNLKGLSLHELQEFVESLGEKRYRAAQLFSWLYGKRAQTFDEMSDISKHFRTILSEAAVIENLELVTKQVSALDGTTKFLFKLADGLVIESVLIPAEEASPSAGKRLTLCISTQVGCPLDCKFCATGTMGFYRNLTTGEIVDQVLQVQNHSPRRVTNIVYMGMGEPMLNYENVMKSVEILNAENGPAIGSRHITVSTAGYADRIRRMADEDRKVKLALSLHSLDNEKRNLIMPITKKYSVPVLLDALQYYYHKTRRRPTIEYILFDGFNDTEADLKSLIAVCRRIPCKVNIIPFHSISFTHPSGVAATLKPTPRLRMEEFVQRLRDAHVTVMIRSSAGEDIDAACGQLAVREEKGKQKSELGGRRSASSERKPRLKPLTSDDPPLFPLRQTS
ncbi:MAG TPA: 23S rRNA (adenine(2503)-C(2))-methyltransferase RlmN [Bacteroidota bacterium]|nr:23S rRNA (adenine(2503)-C(2))-methyltransferase RlmN [Bacteroidota bacterium]